MREGRGLLQGEDSVCAKPGRRKLGTGRRADEHISSTGGALLFTALSLLPDTVPRTQQALNKYWLAE